MQKEGKSELEEGAIGGELEREWMRKREEYSVGGEAWSEGRGRKGRVRE